MSILKTTLASAAGALLATSAFAANSENFQELPKKGMVNLTGIVASVSDSDEFILRDVNGKTIDVVLSTAQKVRVGDKVRVVGELDSEFLGVGREINHATVTTISPRTTSSVEKPRRDYGVHASTNQSLSSNPMVDMGAVTSRATQLRAGLQAGNEAITGSVNTQHDTSYEGGYRN